MLQKNNAVDLAKKLTGLERNRERTKRNFILSVLEAKAHTDDRSFYMI